MTPLVRQQPCEFCPYRKDVPSGVWSIDEYLKLIEYDKPTEQQPIEWFGCHATPEFACNGWAIVHSRRGMEFELLGLRFLEMIRVKRAEIPEPKVPLFESGTAAAEHGMSKIKNPSIQARSAMGKLLDKYPRLKGR